jgi:dienelactone hydrolase
MVKPKSGWFTKRIAEFYEAGLEKHPDKIPAATIRVEQIAGPVLVSSGGSDDIWPSALMADDVVQRLKSGARQYLAADDAVFGALPDKNDEETMRKLAFGGGTPIGNYEAREQRWKETMGFFKGGLGQLSFYEFWKYPESGICTVSAFK